MNIGKWGKKGRYAGQSTQLVNTQGQPGFRHFICHAYFRCNQNSSGLLRLRRDCNPELKNVYTHCQHKFDKMVQQAKRQFVHRQQWSLACSLKSNPKQFWKRFDGITLRGQTHTLELPNSVIDSKGEEQSEEVKVLCCWKEYFSTLLTPKLQTHVSLPITVLPHPV